MLHRTFGKTGGGGGSIDIRENHQWCQSSGNQAVGGIVSNCHSKQAIHRKMESQENGKHHKTSHSLLLKPTPCPPTSKNYNRSCFSPTFHICHWRSLNNHPATRAPAEHSSRAPCSQCTGRAEKQRMLSTKGYQRSP